jgi:hypothetical protein
MKSSTNLLTTIVGFGLFFLSPATVNARIWKDATGKFEIDAEFISLVGDNVELKSTDGRILKLPLAKLSEADRAVAMELAKTAAPAPAPAAKGGERQKIAIDGNVADWNAIPLVIEAANSPVVNQEVDVKQLKIGSDDKNLYIYVTTTIAPLKAIENMKEGGAESIFVMYVDTDGDATTGSENYELIGANGKKINGFDLMVTVFVGRDASSIGAPGAKDGPFARYNTYGPAKGGFSMFHRKGLGEEYSVYPDSSIALCPMGIELALPRETYKIKPEAKIRLLMHKQGSMDQAVYSEGTYQQDVSSVP